MLQQDQFVNHPEKERLLGRLEGILVGQWAERQGLTLKECYESCGISVPDGSLTDVFAERLPRAAAPTTSTFGVGISKVTHRIEDGSGDVEMNQPKDISISQETEPQQGKISIADKTQSR